MSAPSTESLNVLSFSSTLSEARITNLDSVNFITSPGVPLILLPSSCKPLGSLPEITL